MKKITFGLQKLTHGVEVNINPTICQCRGCFKNIYWATTKKNKLTPVTFVNNHWQSHFIDCPQANKFRKKIYD